MESYRFKLEPYKGKNTRHRCPACGKEQVFIRYLDMETRDYLSSEVGRCNREISCGYHYSPKQFFVDNPTSKAPMQKVILNGVVKQKVRDTSYIPEDMFRKSLSRYEGNNFVKFLRSLFCDETCEQLISNYFIGTATHWEGATVFWQVDAQGRIRTGKIMLYSSDTGRRVKNPFNHITWTHSALKLPDFNLQQCLFGEHLLRRFPDKPVGIVESEKTAIIASAYYPKFVWLAAGSLSNLKPKRCKVLCGRNVVLFPDLGAYVKWEETAKNIMGVASIKVADFLEQNACADEVSKGLDLADYLISCDNKQKTSLKPDLLTVPKQEKLSSLQQDQEYYKYTYSKLCNLIGEEKALRKVKMYQELSDHYRSYTNFIIHSCPLLTSISHVKL